MGSYRGPWDDGNFGLTNKGGGTLKPKKPKDGDNNDVKLAEIYIVLKINNTRRSYFYFSSLRLTRGACKVFCVEVGSVWKGTMILVFGRKVFSQLAAGRDDRLK